MTLEFGQPIRTFTGDTLWYESNPTQFIDIDGNGFATLESDREDNITVTPGYYAGDINFPDPSDTEIIFTPGNQTMVRSRV